MVSVLDLEQYHPRSEDQMPPYSGPPDDTDVSLSTMSISSEDQTIKHARRARLMVGSLSWKGLVGRGGLEPPTSRLSGVRSNQLSYRPGLACRALRTGIGMVEPIGIEPMTS